MSDLQRLVSESDQSVPVLPAQNLIDRHNPNGLQSFTRCSVYGIGAECPREADLSGYTICRPSAGPNMIRALTTADLPRLTELHSRGTELAPDQQRRSQLAYEQLFPLLYEDHPWQDSRFPSLVAEDRSGQLTGVLGVMNRPFLLNGTEITAAISAELFVDPSSRSSLAGIQLLKQFLNGPQQLSIADVANNSTRQLWTRLGGRVMSTYGLSWMTVLSPCRFGLAMGAGRSPLVRLASPLARLGDTLGRRFFPTEVDLRVAQLQSEPLTPHSFARLLPEMLGHHALHPVVSEDAAEWLWNRFNFVSRGAGPSRQTLVLSRNGEPLGWHVYQWKPGRVARVSQLVARPDAQGEVFGHLVRTLRQSNIPGAIGRLQPEFLEVLSDAGCLFRRRSRRVLVHSKDADVLGAFESSKAFLSLLDGEGAVQLWNDPVDAVRLAAASRPERFAVSPQLA